MRIQPDGPQAGRDQAAVTRLLSAVLSVIDTHAQLASAGKETGVLWYPGLVAVAHEAQRAQRAAQRGSGEERGVVARLQAALQEAVEQAQASARRAQDCACPAWKVDLAPPEPHLNASLARAVAQAPKRPDRADDLARMAVADWRAEQREAVCAASCLLASVWPEMLAEMKTVVRQVVLLQGYGIDGFTDFTAHGAIFVNHQRLEPGVDGVPVDARLAEALVHEATHNRCNAAAVSRPFLAGGHEDFQSLVMTPLRPDPRPLTGLFQQLVVLVRCWILYDRLVHRAAAVSGEEGLRVRRHRLLAQATQGLATLQHHCGELTVHGRDVVAEAEDLLSGRPALRMQAERTETRPFGNVQVFHPFPECQEVVFGRVAARSPAFASTCASGEAPVVIGSAAGGSAEEVIPRARGELLERISNILAGRAAEKAAARRAGHAGPGRTCVATFAQLRRTGVAAMDPAAWPGLEAAADLRGARMLWVAGQSLLTEEEILVPASAVYLHHRPPPGCVQILQPGSTGVSAHESWQAATRHALLEVLERDLASRSWYRVGARPLHSGRPPLPSELNQVLERLGLVATVLVLPGPASLRCVVACLHTSQHREQSFGARCTVADDRSMLHGIKVAAYEALMVRWSMGTPVAQRAWKAMEPASLPRGPLEHALWTFHRQDSLGRWLAWAVRDGGEPASLPIQSVSQADAGTDWRRLARLLAEQVASDVVAVDTTTPQVCGDGVTVVRVVAPGARRLPADERNAPSPHDPGAGDCLPHPFG
jgi:ribosomal protein S12 methylthiotransferase accessory factor